MKLVKKIGGSAVAFAVALVLIVPPMAAYAVDDPGASSETIVETTTTEEVVEETEATEEAAPVAAEPFVEANFLRIIPTSNGGGGGDDNTNNTPYWEGVYSSYNAVCYKHTYSGGAHGTVVDQEVQLSPYGANWYGSGYVVLIVNGGSNDAVYEFPVPGDQNYVSPLNGGGNIPDVSHWIVCKGDIPEEPELLVATAPLTVTDATCESGAILVWGTPVNAAYTNASTPDGTVGPADYNVVANANEGAEFDPGIVQIVWEDELAGPLTGPDCDGPPPTFGSCPTATQTVNVYQDTAVAQGIGITFTRDNGTLVWDGASWIFSTPASNDKITFGLSSADFLIPLHQLTALSFEGVLLAPGSNPDQIVAFNVPVDVNGSAPGGFTTIVVEAVYNDGSFDAFMGGDAIVWSSNPVNEFPNRDTFESWKFFLENNPDTMIGGRALLNQGGGNAGLVTRVTSFTVGNSVECITYVPSVRTMVTLVVPEVQDLCGTADDQYGLPASTDDVVYTRDGRDIVATLTDESSEFDTLPLGWVDNEDGTATYAFTNTEWNSAPCVTKVTLDVPAPQDDCGTANDQYVLPTNTEGVAYNRDGRDIVATITDESSEFDTLPLGWVDNQDGTATFAFTNTQWSSDPCVIEGAPAAVTFNDPCGTKDDTFTVPAVPVGANWHYEVDGKIVVAGTYPATGKVTVDAVADDGYAFSKGTTTSWSQSLTDKACPPVLALTGFEALWALLLAGLLVSVGTSLVIWKRRNNTSAPAEVKFA